MAQGSPPRVRGKGAVKIKAQPQAGITPACAGKRLIVTSHNARTWDHPRVCGEKPEFLKSLSQGAGSPPRVRGKGQAGCEVVVEFGITPACAGKRVCLSCMLPAVRDHPRVCGEKVASHKAGNTVWGSPPRVRGKVFRDENVDNAAGITPACAGKSCFSQIVNGCGRDHPRVCGEKSLFFMASVLLKGSPPRVRGKGTAIASRRSLIGITPACAGKS